MAVSPCGALYWQVALPVVECGSFGFMCQRSLTTLSFVSFQCTVSRKQVRLLAPRYNRIAQVFWDIISHHMTYSTRNIIMRKRNLGLLLGRPNIVIKPKRRPIRDILEFRKRYWYAVDGIWERGRAPQRYKCVPEQADRSSK
jgi:hypothetical protein